MKIPQANPRDHVSERREFKFKIEMVSKPPLGLNLKCWTETSNPRNIPDIPAVGRLSPPFYPAGF
jgi:hypothetical protein